MLNYFQDDYSSISSSRLSEETVSTTEDGIGIMYPNPATDQATYEITLEEHQAGQLELFDMLGQPLRIYQLVEGGNKIEIDLSSLSSGMYLYRIFINGEAKTSDVLVISK